MTALQAYVEPVEWKKNEIARRQISKYFILALQSIRCSR